MYSNEEVLALKGTICPLPKIHPGSEGHFLRCVFPHILFIVSHFSGFLSRMVKKNWGNIKESMKWRETLFRLGNKNQVTLLYRNGRGARSRRHSSPSVSAPRRTISWRRHFSRPMEPSVVDCEKNSHLFRSVLKGTASSWHLRQVPSLRERRPLRRILYPEPPQPLQWKKRRKTPSPVAVSSFFPTIRTVEFGSFLNLESVKPWITMDSVRVVLFRWRDFQTWKGDPILAASFVIFFCSRRGYACLSRSRLAGTFPDSSSALSSRLQSRASSSRAKQENNMFSSCWVQIQMSNPQNCFPQSAI